MKALDAKFFEVANGIYQTVSDKTNGVTQAYGSGSPESSLSASAGSIYADYTNGDIYLKTGGTLASPTNTGWTQLANLADLASNANGLGAALIGIEDTGGLITATNVEAALAELMTAINAMTGGLTNAGTWDATTADPSGGMANNTYLIVSVTGTTSVTTVNKGAFTGWTAGDWILKDNAGGIHHVDNTDLAANLSLGTATSTTRVVESSSGTNVTLPQAAAESAAGAADGTAGLLSDADKLKLDQTDSFSVAIGDGATTSIAVTHNLGTVRVGSIVRITATGEIVEPTVTNNSTTQTTFNFSIAPAANEYTVEIFKVDAA